MKSQKETIFKYYFSQKELKKLLEIEGNIESINLFSGLSINDKEKNISGDKCIYEIKTRRTEHE